MQCFMMAFLYILFVQVSEGITTHSVTGCTDNVVLNCSNTEMIHVERIAYYNGTDCNQAVTDLQVCGQPVTGSDTGLIPGFIPYCNGRASCYENLYYSYCPDSKAARVDYRCIPGNNVKGMCGEFIIEYTNRIFLSTPNYPSSPTFTDISPCRCSIRGSSITSIQILELILLTSDDGSKSSLEIKYGDVTYKTESSRIVINERLSTASTTAEIILNHNGINDLYLWIEIQGVGMRVFCNDDGHAISSTLSSTLASPSTRSTEATTTTLVSEEINKSSSQPQVSVESNTEPPSSPALIPTILSSSPSTRSTLATTSKPVSKESTIEPISSSPTVIQTTDSSSSTTPDSSSPTADIKFQSQDKDTTIIILAVLLTLCLLITSIATVTNIVLLRKKKLVWVKGRESNAYSGLDRTQRVAGNDGSYQELNTMNPTPQYYNTPQDTQHDYQHVC